jgi:MFS family permease
MDCRPDRTRAAVVAAIGFAGLAAAMGIGRFAFTPLMPLMQDTHGLSLAGGAWLATANYVGYLLGAIACFVAPPRPGTAARAGLATVAATTLPMAVTDTFAAWAVLRLVCGAASAYVLVGVSSWALAWLAMKGRASWAGWVFAGVGAGIVLAGATAMAAGLARVGPDAAWAALGVAATLVAGFAWRPFGVPVSTAPGPATGPSRAAPLDGAAWLLVACYGALGIGYIVPATFLPAMARALVPDPAVFGWAWPVFGAAAAASTALASAVFGRAPPRHLAAGGMAVMAVGVAAPAVWPGLGGVLAGAVCVGGTFMVVTMASMQEARERAAGGDATRLVAAMTAAFALGQLLGPLVVGLWSDAERAIGITSLAAAGVLAAATWALLAVRPRRQPHPLDSNERIADA